MKSLSKALIFPVLALLFAVAAPALHAQTIATLNCTDKFGNPPINTPLFAFNVNTDKSAGIFDATAYIDISLFSTLLSTESSYYTSCSIIGGTSSIMLTNASVVDVSATGVGAGQQSASAQIYTSVLFTFTQLTSGGVVIVPNAVTPDVKAKALAALRARGPFIPK